MSRSVCTLLLLAMVGLAQEGAPPQQKEKAEKAREIARIEEVLIKVDGTEDPYPAFPFGPKRLNYHAFLNYIREVARDPEVDAVLLDMKRYTVGWSRLLEVRNALKQLRQSGKKVFIYKEYLDTADLVLASVADRISVPESGIVVLPGLAIESWYLKNLLAKLHLRFDVIHIGEYKTAGESLVRDSMSPELKESLDPVLDEFFASMTKAIAEGRGLSVDAVKKAIDQGILTPRAAKAAGLIDRVEYHDQFKAGIKAYFPDKRLKKAKSRLDKGKFKFDANNPFAVLSMMMAAMFGQQKEKAPEGPKIAIVYCTGLIVSGKSQYDWSGNIAAMGSETIVKAIDAAHKKKDVKAIVLRINSPGGSGLASDMIWRAVERAKEAKPVIASMGDVAASGGYWIAMNSNLIVAEPQTITGSIGVVGIIPNVDDFYTWVGISPQRLSRGARAEGLLTTKGLTEEDKEQYRKLMQSFYGDFVAKVAAGRGKTPAEIEPLARGRIWTGRDALKHGLIDRLGGLGEAIALARERGGIEGDQAGQDYHVLEMPRRKGPFEFLQEMFETRLGISHVALKEMPLLRRVLWHLQMLRRVAQDRICVIHPELTGLAHAWTASR
ncbi:MAG: signal peptide peptidase SppA [Planctomycetota bacterium]|jgi:protease-4